MQKRKNQEHHVLKNLIWKKLIFFKMQNSAPFFPEICSRFKNGFWQRIFTLGVFYFSNWKMSKKSYFFPTISQKPWLGQGCAIVLVSKLNLQRNHQKIALILRCMQKSQIPVQRWIFYWYFYSSNKIYICLLPKCLETYQWSGEQNAPSYGWFTCLFWLQMT